MENFLWGIAQLIKENIALIIAILALLVSLNQLKQKEKHDRLSVQPLIEAKSEFLYTIAKVYLINVGFGPARILDYKIFDDGNAVKDMETIIDKLKINNKLPKSTIELQKFTFPKILRPNEEIILYSATPPTGSQFSLIDLGLFVNVLSKLSVKIEHESLYQEKKKDSIQFTVK